MTTRCVCLIFANLLVSSGITAFKYIIYGFSMEPLTFNILVISACSCGHLSGSTLSSLKSTAPLPTWATLSTSRTGA